MLLLTGLAHAHVGALLAGVDVDPIAGDTLLEASFGLLHTVDDEAWFWTCHEAVTAEDAVAVPDYVRVDGGLLVWLDEADQARDATEPVYRSPDGCSWAPVEGLTDREVADLDVADDGLILLAVGSTPGYPELNPVWRSQDGGASWYEAAVVPDLELVSITLGTELAWATARGDDGHVLLRSQDYGVTWTREMVDVGGWTGSADPELRVEAARDGQAWLVLAALDGSTLLRADDDGVEALLAVEGQLVDVELDGDGLWVFEAQAEVWYAEDATRAPQRVDAPEALALGLRDGELWLTAYAETTGALLFRDGEVALRPHQVEDPFETCDEESDHVLVCEPLWEQLREALDAFDVDTALGDSDPPDTGAQGILIGDEEPAAEGCGCRAAPVSAPCSSLLPVCQCDFAAARDSCAARRPPCSTCSSPAPATPPTPPRPAPTTPRRRSPTTPALPARPARPTSRWT